MFRPLAQLVVRPYLLVTRCSPVTRSSTKKYPLRAAVTTSFRILPLNIAIHQDGRLRGIVVVHVVRRGLEIPGHLAGVHVDRNQRAGEQVVPVAARAGGESGRRIAGAENIELGLGIVSARNPCLRAAVTRRIQARPGVQPGSPLFMGTV